MTGRADLVRLLADGGLHSGEALARELGVTRAAVAKRIRALEARGVEVASVPRRGYRLAAPLDLLDPAAIDAALDDGTRARRRDLVVLDETGSTNGVLLAQPPPPAGSFRACLAEYQTAGRGRRGRSWVAPFGGGLCLSYAWLFAEPPADLAALSLAVGVASLRALARCGAPDLSLKWPNDLVRGEAKVGGILCELRAEAAGPAFVVIGIGLNVRLSAAAREAIAAAGGLPPADLAGPVGAPSRNALAAALLAELTWMATTFEREGFAPFRDPWAAADALRGRPVRVLAHGGARDGIARGIDPDGALRVEIDGRIERIASGEVSVRSAA